VNGASRATQIRIYIGKCFRVFINDKGFKTFISAAIITLLISMVTGDKMFLEYNESRNGAFALVCACIWIGIFNSIQSICKERDIIKREHRSGLHISSYITSHMVFELVLSFVEAIIVTAITCIANLDNFPGSGVMMPAFLELFFTFFFIIFSSDALGLMVSSIVKTPNTAMTVMPFVLIIQLAMSGMIFELEGFTDVISNITIGKWGLNAVCITANVNDMPGAALFPHLAENYEFTVGHLLGLWGLLIGFALLYGAIAIVALKFVDKDKR
jgi:hypothetical protein